jgi:hypothetical protein
MSTESGHHTRSVRFASDDSNRSVASNMRSSVVAPTDDDASSPLQQLVVKHGKLAIAAFAKVRRHEKIVLAFNDPDHIPRSARIAFQLQASRPVQNAPEFKALAAETSTMVSSFQLQLALQIKKCTELELVSLHKALAECFLEAICIWAKAHFVLQNPVNCSAAGFMYPYICIVTTDSGFRRFLDKLSQQESAVVVQRHLGDYSAAQASIDGHIYRSDHQTFLENCKTVLLQPLATWDSTVTIAQQTAQLNALLVTTQTEQATASTVAAMDSEPPCNYPVMQSLITTTIRKELTGLKLLPPARDRRRNNNATDLPSPRTGQQSPTKAKSHRPREKKDSASNANHPKNRQRGATAGASEKKKSRQPTTKSAATPQTNANTSRAANDSDSGDAQKRSRRDNTRRPSKKKSRSITPSKRHT